MYLDSNSHHTVQATYTLFKDRRVQRKGKHALRGQARVWRRSKRIRAGSVGGSERLLFTVVTDRQICPLLGVVRVTTMRVTVSIFEHAARHRPHTLATEQTIRIQFTELLYRSLQ
ncbi:hypothetical protein EVAR_41782_1 [Eumeta japonica]|uniref:Uncharacterized protein n=1 Tax=Eumeta variegata TaxID=151549 RepID=A0A4C1W1I8_EUMVA|nr:hypothetical protein EVAR_41782_1 [Eumeta japonica]